MTAFFHALARFMQSLIDIVLPRRERAVRLDTYSPEMIIVAPAEHSIHGVEIATLLSYRDQAVEDCIRALKYDKSGRAATILASILAEYLREEIAGIRSFSSQPILLVPVPLFRDRLRERGFNQIELVLESLPIEFRDGSLASIEKNALLRVRDTAQQTHLTREERLSNVVGAFALSDRTRIENAHVILIDDVTTTGATLAEAARPLFSVCMSVNLLALARA